MDKLVHLALYAVLGLLLARALRRAGRLSSRMVAASLGGIAAFAALDEWHQRWIPGRSADLPDWIADVIGGAVALLLAARHASRAPVSIT